MFAHQRDMVEVMMVDDRLVAPGDVVRGGQESKVAMLQRVLFVGGKVAAFRLAHAGRAKNERRMSRTKG
jgi:hypothetical protein